MWIVVYLSTSKSSAEKLVEVLNNNNIISRLRCVDKDQDSFEVLVPQAELNQAQNLIIDNELF